MLRHAAVEILNPATLPTSTSFLTFFFILTTATGGWRPEQPRANQDHHRLDSHGHNLCPCVRAAVLPGRLRPERL